MNTTLTPASLNKYRLLRGVGCAATVAAFICLATVNHMLFIALAGSAKDFFQNTDMTSASNYNPAGTPTNTDDVRINRSSASLRITGSNLTAESLSVDNSNTFTIANATSTTTNSTLRVGNSAGFTNAFSGVVNDLIYLTNGSNLIIQGPNASAGTGTLSLALQASGNFNVGASSTLTISSVVSGPGLGIAKTGAGLTVLSGANTYSGTTTVSAGTLQLNRAGGGTIPAGNNVVVNGGNLQISSNQTIGNLTMSAGKLTIDAGATLTITGTYNVSGGTINAQGTVKLNGGSVSFPGTGAVVNNGTANTMSSLELALTGSVSLTAAMTISGTLTLTSGTLNNSTNNVTLGAGASVVRDTGSLAAAPTFGPSVNVSYTGATAVTAGSELPAAASVLNNLTINKAGGVALAASPTVNGTLTLTSGNIDASTNGATLIIASGGAVSGASNASYVSGSVQKQGLAASFIFPVGYNAANAYTPVALTNTSGGGTLTVTPTHSAKTPPLNASTSLGEFWTLTLNSGALTTDLTFHYLASDVHGNVADYRVIRVEDNNSAVSFPGSVNVTNHTGTVMSLQSFSVWTVGEPNAPTAVKLGAARAEIYPAGVWLSWASGAEANNVGYNVYREQGGRRVRVNRSIVAGSALTFGAATQLRAGAGYEWWDAGATGATQYWLEDIDLDGTRTMHGPLVPVAGQGAGEQFTKTYRRPLLLSELNGQAQNGAGLFETGGPAVGARTPRIETVNTSSMARTIELSSAPVAPVEQQWQLAGQWAVKLGVKQDGWYRVTQSELVAAGFDANTDARFLQLYVDGRQVPMRVNGGETSLGANGSIEFYGQGLDTPTTDTHIYWLVVGTAPGLRIPVSRPGGKLSDGWKPGGAGNTSGLAAPTDVAGASVLSTSEPKVPAPLGAPSQSFAYTVERKERLLYFSSLLNGEAENYFGQLVNAQPVTETLVVRHLAKSSDKQPAQLEVALQGVSAGAHTLVVSFNGGALDKLTFNAQEHTVAVFDIPATLLHEGNNTVTLSVAGTETDLSLVDYLRLTYAHTYNADDNLLELTTASAGQLSIDGFTASSIRVVDVTDPAAVVELTPRILVTAAGYAARLQTDAGRTLLAFTDDRAGQAAAITSNQPSTWHADGQTADMLIIAHRSLLESVAPLKALRERQGLRVSVIDVADLYDEFSYGAHTPQALKEFLKWTTTHWQQAPRYVLLVGDATIDPRDYEGRGPFDLVPTKLIDTAAMETASDEWLADFDGTGCGALSLGRLPVRTPAEAATVIDKIVNFTPTAVSQAAVLVSDRSGSNDLDFTKASQAVAAQLPSATAATFIKRDDGTPDVVRQQIVDAIDAGPMVVNFMGHGSTTRWTGDDLLRAADAVALTNDNRLPLFVMMTCLNGYFTGTVVDSLAESVLKAQRGGAVAVWASSGVTMPVDQQTVNQELYRQVFNSVQPATLGEAVRQAKQLTSDPDIRRTWILFGDPSMRLR